VTERPPRRRGAFSLPSSPSACSDCRRAPWCASKGPGPPWPLSEAPGQRPVLRRGRLRRRAAIVIIADGFSLRQGPEDGWAHASFIPRFQHLYRHCQFPDSRWRRQASFSHWLPSEPGVEWTLAQWAGAMGLRGDRDHWQRDGARDIYLRRTGLKSRRVFWRDSVPGMP